MEHYDFHNSISKEEYYQLKLIAALCGCTIEEVCAAFVEQGLRDWWELPLDESEGL